MLEPISPTEPDEQLDDELLLLDDLDETSTSGDSEDSADSWKVLVVDDEEQVHAVTRLALKNFKFEDRPLEIISAYSKREAEQILDVHPDTAVLLLDVVMETDRAGLELVQYIRESLQNLFVRIILRTGQPGAAPEKLVIEGYDINDYKTKTELTQEKLVSSMVTAIRSYRDILNLEDDRQEVAVLNEELQEFNQSLEALIRKRTQELEVKNQQLEQEIQARQQAQEELQAAYRELERANQQLAELANHDALTGLANRRRFNEYLQQIWKQALRERQPLTLILCDIDYFKQYNDTYGHLVGDTCLQQVARAIQQVLERPLDLAARFGGEEFAVILLDADATGGNTVAEKIQAGIAELQIPHSASAISEMVTISAGIAATIPNTELNVETFINEADSALYTAKQEGRDRIVVRTHE
ncbi:MAG: diguanylate cyclase [Cyanobacteria bacterium P01_D01_bin.123]